MDDHDDWYWNRSFVWSDPPWLKNPPWVLVLWQHLAKAMKGSEIWWNGVWDFGTPWQIPWFITIWISVFSCFLIPTATKGGLKTRNQLNSCGFYRCPRFWIIARFGHGQISNPKWFQSPHFWRRKKIEVGSLAKAVLWLSEGPPDTLIWDKRVVRNIINKH